MLLLVLHSEHCQHPDMYLCLKQATAATMAICVLHAICWLLLCVIKNTFHLVVFLGIVSWYQLATMPWRGLQKYVIDRVLEDDGVTGDQYGPYTPETIKEERERLKIDKVRPRNAVFEQCIVRCIEVDHCVLLMFAVPLQ